MIKLGETRGSRAGAYCGAEGLYLGCAALIEHRNGRYWRRADDEIAVLLAAAYDTAEAAPRVAARLPMITAALNDNDLARAMIAALQLGLGDVGEEGLGRLAQADALTKHNFNPDEPRDWHGRWTSDGSGSTSPPVRPARPSRGAAPSNGRIWERFPNSEFRNRLAIAERSADKPHFGYREVGRNGALGRYQMTRYGLLAAGMMDRKGTWTGKYGIHSRDEFLASPAVQERALTDFLEDTERQLRAYGAFAYLGHAIAGQVNSFTVTRAGLVAAGHREGAKQTDDYLLKIANHGFTSRGLALNEKERAVEQRLREFTMVPYE